MAEILVNPITQQEALGRTVFSGGMMGGSGFYGSDCLCGHCEAVMFRDFNPDLLRGDYVFQCGVCSGFNERPPEDEIPPEDESPPEEMP